MHRDEHSGRARRLGGGVVVGLLAGCLAHQSLPKPPPNVVEVAGGRATWREYGGHRVAGICDAEPRFLLDELTGFDALLKRFLDKAAGDEPNDWPEARIEGVEEWVSQLEPAVAQHEKNLARVRRCAFARTSGYPWLLERSGTLLAAFHARVPELTDVVHGARLARQVAEWNVRVRDEERSRRLGCPARARTPTVYFAYRDVGDVTHWYFCDGATASGHTGREPAVEDLPLAPSNGQRRFTKKDYLLAAKKIGADEVLSPPDAIVLKSW